MKRVVRQHNRTITLSAEAYAEKLTTHAYQHLQAIVDAYRSASPDVQALLMARLVFVTALTWASSQEHARR